MMMFLVMIVGIVVAAVVPATIWFVFRTVGKIATAAARPTGLDASAEARLARIEEAIDAMAMQIERLRRVQEGRYVSAGSDEPRTFPAGDDPPPA
jgi:hypothetical protein